jgi:hypothetical protein
MMSNGMNKKRLPLEKLKRWPSLKRQLEQQHVHIWSGEWMLYWRSNGAGYTDQRSEAGVYTLEDALLRTFHCSREKKIAFEPTAPDYVI